MNHRRRFGYYVLILVLGVVVGSVLGEALGFALPEGVVKKFFLNSVGFEISPTKIDLKVLHFTLGFGLNINIIGVVGVFLVAYFLRWME